jgi:hypothetical protein
MTPKRRDRATLDPAPSTVTTTANSDSSLPASDFDFDQRVVSQVDWSIWRALFDGHFRLAVQCDVCGRWLTANASKKAHRGPRCSARAGAL